MAAKITQVTVDYTMSLDNAEIYALELGGTKDGSVMTTPISLRSDLESDGSYDGSYTCNSVKNQLYIYFIGATLAGVDSSISLTLKVDGKQVTSKTITTGPDNSGKITYENVITF